MEQLLTTIFLMLLACGVLTYLISSPNAPTRDAQDNLRKNQLNIQLEAETREKLKIGLEYSPFFYIIQNFNLHHPIPNYDWRKIKICEQIPNGFKGICIESNIRTYVNDEKIFQSISPKLKTINWNQNLNQVFISHETFLKLESYRIAINSLNNQISNLTEKQNNIRKIKKEEYEKQYLWKKYFETFPKSLLKVNNGYDFEKFIANLYIYTKSFKVELTSKSADQGVDIVLTDLNTNIKTAIQTKFYTNTVGNSSIMEVVGGKAYYKCKEAIVITNSTFTLSAVKLAQVNKVKLIDGAELTLMCKEILPNQEFTVNPFNEEEFTLIAALARKNFNISYADFNSGSQLIDAEIFKHNNDLYHQKEKFIKILKE